MSELDDLKDSLLSLAEIANQQDRPHRAEECHARLRAIKQLERELAEARAELKRKDEVIILCGAVLKGCLAMNPLDPFQRGDLIRQAIGCVEAELAQGGKENT